MNSTGGQAVFSHAGVRLPEAPLLQARPASSTSTSTNTEPPQQESQQGGGGQKNAEKEFLARKVLSWAWLAASWCRSPLETIREVARVAELDTPQSEAIKCLLGALNEIDREKVELLADHRNVQQVSVHKSLLQHLRYSHSNLMQELLARLAPLKPTGQCSPPELTPLIRDALFSIGTRAPAPCDWRVRATPLLAVNPLDHLVSGVATELCASHIAVLKDRRLLCLGFEVPSRGKIRKEFIIVAREDGTILDRQPITLNNSIYPEELTRTRELSVLPSGYGALCVVDTVLRKVVCVIMAPPNHSAKRIYLPHPNATSILSVMAMHSTESSDMPPDLLVLRLRDITYNSQELCIFRPKSTTAYYSQPYWSLEYNGMGCLTPCVFPSGGFIVHSPGMLRICTFSTTRMDYVTTEVPVSGDPRHRKLHLIPRTRREDGVLLWSSTGIGLLPVSLQEVSYQPIRKASMITTVVSLESRGVAWCEGFGPCGPDNTFPTSPRYGFGMHIYIIRDVPLGCAPPSPTLLHKVSFPHPCSAFLPDTAPSMLVAMPDGRLLWRACPTSYACYMWSPRANGKYWIEQVNMASIAAMPPPGTSAFHVLLSAFPKLSNAKVHRWVANSDGLYGALVSAPRKMKNSVRGVIGLPTAIAVVSRHKVTFWHQAEKGYELRQTVDRSFDWQEGKKRRRVESSRAWQSEPTIVAARFGRNMDRLVIAIDRSSRAYSPDERGIYLVHHKAYTDNVVVGIPDSPSYLTYSGKENVNLVSPVKLSSDRVEQLRQWYKNPGIDTEYLIKGSAVLSRQTQTGVFSHSGTITALPGLQVRGFPSIVRWVEGEKHILVLDPNLGDSDSDPVQYVRRQIIRGWHSLQNVVALKGGSLVTFDSWLFPERWECFDPHPETNFFHAIHCGTLPKDEHRAPCCCSPPTHITIWTSSLQDLNGRFSKLQEAIQHAGMRVMLANKQPYHVVVPLGRLWYAIHSEAPPVPCLLEVGPYPRVAPRVCPCNVARRESPDTAMFIPPACLPGCPANPLLNNATGRRRARPPSYTAMSAPRREGEEAAAAGVAPSSPCGLVTLPDEMVVKIASYLSPADRMRLGFACPELTILFQDEFPYLAWMQEQQKT
eukprot:CAMPEP_0177641494 /NCGR_PEP_ID=MMETSP0447-20121125/7092_1 /TAXON_ID=0 /ORGANISM="Stygamoeba regulata, Strain BSH-02190019" /LENGTH=1112 /DNA_ID=CAMNT_0019143607 /DNA_START=114 /DNA_END=3452 /DNA_ORIENTATION=-